MLLLNVLLILFMDQPFLPSFLLLVLPLTVSLAGITDGAANESS